MKLPAVALAALLLPGCISFPKHITSNCAALPLPPVPQVELTAHFEAADDEFDNLYTTDAATVRSITDAILRLSQALKQHRDWIAACREKRIQE